MLETTAFDDQPPPFLAVKAIVHDLGNECFSIGCSSHKTTITPAQLPFFEDLGYATLGNRDYGVKIPMTFDKNACFPEITGEFLVS